MNERIQKMIDEYAEAQAQLFTAQLRDKEAVAALLSLLEESSGPKTFQGTTHSVKVTPKVNVSYQRDRGEPHPLQKLVEQFPSFMSMLRIEYRESGGKVRELVGDYKCGIILSEGQAQLAQAILKTRKVTQGKPTISIKEIDSTDIPSE